MSMVQMNLFTDFPMHEVSTNIIGGAIIDKAFPSINSEATSLPKKKKTKISNKIEDFGEKIGGARKDIFQTYRAMLKKETEEDLKTQPLSKFWPAPDYEKLIENGMEKEKVAMLRALRDVIPNKPKMSYKLRAYIKEVATLRSIAIDILDGNVEVKNIDSMEKLFKNINKVIYLTGSQIRSVYGLYSIYNKNGHKQSFRGFELSEFHSSKGKTYAFVNRHQKNFFNPAGLLCYESEITDLQDISKSVDALLLKYGKDETKEDNKIKNEKLTRDLYRLYQRYDKEHNKYYSIGRKIGRKILFYPQNFSEISWEEYQKFLDERLNELDEYFTSCKKIPNEREENNNARMGASERLKDITPEDFMSAFGFRGVEFGNYVEKKRRQEDLNEAYDALMDLSKVLNIPTQAISLGGKLGLAFGARGRGGINAPMAHYEPDFEVINLTKKKGAGSLAHEWFHALDHSLAKYHGFSSNAVTETIRGRDAKAMNIFNKQLGEKFSEFVEKYSFYRDIGLRSRSDKLDELRGSKGYWGSYSEMGARIFEAIIKRKLDRINIRNDFLVNIKSQNNWEVEANPEQPYPYPTEEELDILEPYFDRVIASLKQEKVEDKIMLYSARGNGEELEENINQVPYNKLSAEEKGLHALGEQIMGVQTVFIEGDEKLHGKFDRDTNIMYLNRNSEISLPWVVMHEGFHIIKNADENLHKELMEFAEKNNICSKEIVEQYRKERNNPNLSDEVIKEELLADAFADYKTGRRTIKELSEQKPIATSKLCKFFNNIISDAKKFFLGVDKTECDSKYPQAKISDKEFNKFAEHIEELHNEHLKAQNLTKGQEILMLEVNELQNDKYFASPYAYNPKKQAEFDLKFIKQFASNGNIKDVATVIDTASPLGKKGYSAELLRQNNIVKNKVNITR